MKTKKENGLKTIEIILVSSGLVVLIGLLIFIIIEYLFLYKESNEKSWNVYFSRVINTECTEGATCSTPVIYKNSTSTGNYEVTFSSANQKAIYEITIENKGNLDAKLTSIVLASPTCKGTATEYTDAYADQLMVCEKLMYKLVDEDGNTIPIGAIIESKESAKYYLKLTYLDDEYFVGYDERLTAPVTITGLELSLNYTQAGKK